MSLPDGLISFGPDANCTLALCPLEASLLHYQPSVPANSVFIAVFALSLAIHVVQGTLAHAWGFMLSMLCGCILEIIGYIGRLMLHNNPFSFAGTVMQIVCITVAPVFYCSAIYVLLSQVVNFVDRPISRFGPKLYYWIFIPADIVSLLLQAAGAGLSCMGSNEDDIQVGVNVSLAGLIFQVVTLTIFCMMFMDYVYLAWRSHARDRLQQLSLFLAFLFTAILLILLRCVYRVVELHAGYFSEMFRDEPLFIALESSVMCAAVLFLDLGHPGRRLQPHRKLESRDQVELLDG